VAQFRSQCSSPREDYCLVCRHLLYFFISHFLSRLLFSLYSQEEQIIIIKPSGDTDDKNDKINARICESPVLLLCCCVVVLLLTVALCSGTCCCFMVWLLSCGSLKSDQGRLNTLAGPR